MGGEELPQTSGPAGREKALEASHGGRWGGPLGLTSAPGGKKGKTGPWGLAVVETLSLGGKVPAL